MSLQMTDKVQLLERARAEVRSFAHKNGTVTADDVDKALRVALGPSAGSIFKGSDFHFTGKRITSKLPSSHGRELKVWMLTVAGEKRVTAATVPATRQAQNRLTPVPAPPKIQEAKHVPFKHTPLPSWLS